MDYLENLKKIEFLKIAINGPQKQIVDHVIFTFERFLCLRAKLREAINGFVLRNRTGVKFSHLMLLLHNIGFSSIIKILDKT